jgi:membrane associated rhomboid family serine protease
LDRGLRVHKTRRQVEEWELVLSSVHIACRVTPGESGYLLLVDAADLERAEAELRAYDRENREELALEAPPLEEDRGTGPLNVAFAAATAMGAFYLVTGPRDASVVWFQVGSADAARILEGELWRVVTALSLHADLTHLIGNLLFGTLFLALVGHSLGAGLALALALLAGSGGNVANALLRSSAHVSIGASTAVFGAVGILCGVGAARRQQRGERWRRVVLPLGAGLGLLAMFGSAGGRVDVFAHLFGLLAGNLLGVVVGARLVRPPARRMQWLSGLLAAGALVGSWQLALS